jgi:hypothetical protein
MKNYRFLGEEAEVLGCRLDAAREAYARAKKKSWAKKHWKQVIDRLLFQWRQLPALHDGDAQVAIIPRWTVDYDFYELARPHEYVGVSDRFYQKVFRESVDLDRSWHAHREARLARAQY